MQQRDYSIDDDPYLAALDVVNKHWGTSGQEAMAKCILSLYNSAHSYSMSEILPSLDSANKEIVLAMMNEFSRFGETEELRIAGRWVYKNFPALVELSSAMVAAREEVKRIWRLRQEEERRRLYPDGE